ncbi:histidine-rich glycoprotein isoform X5 [Myiozetetes cayanensis]|uniref:histidine-rich glycoprotein isoform X5 n=1 Tax=Myiozetetes cayanensis TaxID=478635 RepID=UPI00215F05E6|nr:histidine-rich glycoprotein isoform X5 [Myiozetetes cayanensis]
MLLLASAFFLTLLQCSNAQNKASFTPADCNTIETDAGVALDLVNKHRRDGYVFGLFRVADAHELHTGNSSVLYLTLDVLETECPVLSRKHWESCEYSDTYPMDFGQCKIITYTNHLLKKPQLYGFNCTLSPVPPDLLECKDCPVKIEVLEVTEQHKDIATKALKKFKIESNHTNYFAVDKVERVLKMTASREGHILGFSIKETNCSETVQQEDQASECDFLHDWHAHMGFCTARVISDADEPDGTDISCEIYHPWQLGFGRRGKGGKPHRHPHFHHFGHRHHHRHHHRHECPPSSQPRPEDPEHNHNFSKEDQDSHEGLAPPPPPPPHGPDHPHPPHHHGPHCPPPPPPPHGPDHPHPPHHHGPHCPPPPPPHGPHCPPPPPPHGPDHPHPHHHHGPHCPPPPPPHGLDHPHPPHHHGPHCPPPPPPHGPDHPHPPHHHGPPLGHPHHRHHHYRHHCNKTSMSGKYFPCHMTGTVYHIPVLSQQGSLIPPSANFCELSQFNTHSLSTGEGIAFTGSRLTEMPEDPGFPDHPTQSKSCPGKPKLVLPKILPLFPQSSTAENSPI